jgi:hypothetical protein
MIVTHHYNHLAAHFEFTCEAKTIPAIPKGRQQNIVTRIDSTSQFLGGVDDGGGACERVCCSMVYMVLMKNNTSK